MSDCVMFVTDVIALQKVMLEQGIKTNKQLSEVCGVDRNTIGRILKGEEQPSSTTMYKLASGLNMKSDVAGSIFFSPNLRNA